MFDSEDRQCVINPPGLLSRTVMPGTYISTDAGRGNPTTFKSRSTDVGLGCQGASVTWLTKVFVNFK